MMKSSVQRALDELNKLEREADRLYDKSYDAYKNGNIKKSDYYDSRMDEIRCRINGMISCLKLLGFSPWKECTRDNYCVIWHIPQDDIDKICDSI